MYQLLIPQVAMPVYVLMFAEISMRVLTYPLESVLPVNPFRTGFVFLNSKFNINPETRFQKGYKLILLPVFPGQRFPTV